MAADREGVDGAAAARRAPFRLRGARRAQCPGVELAVAAGRALLVQHLAAGGRLPVRRGDVVGQGKGSPAEGRGDVAGDFAGGVAAGVVAHGASRPRIVVPMQDNQPPEPQARASDAPGTWAGPAWPRSWRTASMSRKIPRMPGWVQLRPPPSVFSGSLPPNRSAPLATNLPPSPFGQNPRSSSSSRTVIVKLS